MAEKTIGRHIVEVNNLMHREIIKSDAKEHITSGRNESISHAASCIIAYLYNNKDADIFQKDIEHEFSVRRSTVSKVLTLMEEKGHIKRIEVKTDKRLKKIVLTHKAEAIAEKLTQLRSNVDKKMVEGLSQTELEILVNILEKIKNNLAQED